MLGHGRIDLRNGRIEFAMVPQTITSNPIDLANFSVAQLVTVKGTISKPEMTLNSAGLLKQGVNALITAGIASSTGGLGALIAGGGAAAMFQDKDSYNVSVPNCIVTITGCYTQSSSFLGEAQPASSSRSV